MTQHSVALLELMETDPQMNVEELVNRLSEREGLTTDQAAKRLYQLWQQGEINLQNPNPPRTLSKYFGSWYNLWFWITALMVAFTALSIYGLPQMAPYLYIRYTLGSITVLYLPGSALIQALYPKKEDLEPLERLGLSIGLSLALVPLLGLILNYTPWGIRLNPIFVGLSLLTLALASMAAVRKYGYFRLKMEAINP